MASQTASLYLGEAGDDSFAIALFSSFTHGRSGFMNLPVEAAELPGVRAEPGKDASSFRQRRLGVMGNVWRKTGHQSPVFRGNRASDGLHVTPELCHHVLQGHRFRRLGRLSVEYRSRNEQGHDQSDGGDCTVFWVVHRVLHS